MRASVRRSLADRLRLRLAVRRLDAVVPSWRDRVDPSLLDMRDGCRCVLGQVFGCYADGLTALEQDVLPDLHDAAFHSDFPVELWLAELDRPGSVVDDARDDDRDLVGVV